MTVVSRRVRQQLLAMPTIRQHEDPRITSQVSPNRHDVDLGDLRIDTEFQGLPARLPLRVYISPRLRDLDADPPYAFEDNVVWVTRYNAAMSRWEWGSKSDFLEAFTAAEAAGLVPDLPR